MEQRKFWPGDPCPRTAVYGQYHDRDDEYAGPAFDRTVRKGEQFPASEDRYHFAEKQPVPLRRQ